jgi:hypothetical protein
MRLHLVLLTLLIGMIVWTAQFVHAETWRAADLRAGMKGYGLTVLKGTEIERFEVEILGVLFDMQPGRDMILARCSGLGLEKTGVMAGMSGSPVYVDDRLVGAIAYTWEFGLEPMAGITPFSEMVEFAREPIRAAGPVRRSAGKWGGMMPVRTPISIRPISPALIDQLKEDLAPWHLLPMQGGAAGAEAQIGAEKLSLVPGSAVGVGLVVGDINVTAIGTVTDVQGGRVHAFGHPFLQLGRCDLPMMSAHIHAVLPLQSASVKLGSALEKIGRFDADVSTGIAGRLGPAPAMIPVVMRAQAATADQPRLLRCEVASVPALFSSLFLTTLASGLDSAGHPPAEMTAHVRAIVKFRSHPPIEMDKVFSGESVNGISGLTTALSSVSSLIAKGANNPFVALEVESVECDARIQPERTSASIVHAWVEPSEVLAGEEVQFAVEYRPFRSSDGKSEQATEIRRYQWKTPDSLQPGDYPVVVNSAPADWSLEVRRRPRWNEPHSLQDVLEAIREEAKQKPSTVAIRLETKGASLSTSTADFNELPGGVASILASNPTSPSRSFAEVVVIRESTPWPLEGSKNATLRVVKKPPVRFSSPNVSKENVR